MGKWDGASCPVLQPAWGKNINGFLRRCYSPGRVFLIFEAYRSTLYMYRRKTTTAQQDVWLQSWIVDCIGILEVQCYLNVLPILAYCVLMPVLGSNFCDGNVNCYTMDMHNRVVNQVLFKLISLLYRPLLEIKRYANIIDGWIKNHSDIIDCIIKRHRANVIDE